MHSQGVSSSSSGSSSQNSQVHSNVLLQIQRALGMRTTPAISQPGRSPGLDRYLDTSQYQLSYLTESIESHTRVHEYLAAFKMLYDKGYDRQAICDAFVHLKHVVNVDVPDFLLNNLNILHSAFDEKFKGEANPYTRILTQPSVSSTSGHQAVDAEQPHLPPNTGNQNLHSARGGRHNHKQNKSNKQKPSPQSISPIKVGAETFGKFIEFGKDDDCRIIDMFLTDNSTIKNILSVPCSNSKTAEEGWGIAYLATSAVSTLSTMTSKLNGAISVAVSTATYGAFRGFKFLEIEPGDEWWYSGMVGGGFRLIVGGISKVFSSVTLTDILVDSAVSAATFINHNIGEVNKEYSTLEDGSWQSICLASIPIMVGAGTLGLLVYLGPGGWGALLSAGKIAMYAKHGTLSAVNIAIDYFWSGDKEFQQFIEAQISQAMLLAAVPESEVPSARKLLIKSVLGKLDAVEKVLNKLETESLNLYGKLFGEFHKLIVSKYMGPHAYIASHNIYLAIKLLKFELGIDIPSILQDTGIFINSEYSNAENIDLFVSACMYGDLDYMKQFIQKHPNYLKSSKGNSARYLIQTVAINHLEGFRFLLPYTDDISKKFTCLELIKKERISRSVTKAGILSEEYLLPYIKAILDTGFSPNFDHGEGTPIMCSVVDGKMIKTASLFIKHGVDLQKPCGQLSLTDVAIAHNAWELAALLIGDGGPLPSGDSYQAEHFKKLGPHLIKLHAENSADERQTSNSW